MFYNSAKSITEALSNKPRKLKTNKKHPFIKIKSDFFLTRNIWFQYTHTQLIKALIKSLLVGYKTEYRPGNQYHWHLILLTTGFLA